MLKDIKLMQLQFKCEFEKLAEEIFLHLKDGENLNLVFLAEESQFLRFNKSKIRQSTTALQITINMNFQWNKREITQEVNLSLYSKHNIAILANILENLRHNIKLLPENPFFVEQKNNGKSENIFEGNLSPLLDLKNELLENLKNDDLAGLYCAGPIYRGVKNSQGTSHWYQGENFFFDYSIYNEHRAIKGGYAGSHWDCQNFIKNLDNSREMLDKLSKPIRKISPGRYRTYFAPAALNEIMSLLKWGAFSYAAVEKGNSPLRKLYKGENKFSAMITIEENFISGLVPKFNEMGELTQEVIPLVREGVGAGLLINSKTAQEYKIHSNGAPNYESPRSLKFLPGKLEEKDILKQIGTGLYLSNLHYLNFSDMESARITGMTRFGAFWVENGEIVGPINDLRFDESLYECLGKNLIGVTENDEIIPETSTYFSRSLGAAQLPGILVDNFTFTL